MKILVVEDEKKLAKFIQQGLLEEHYTVDVAHDGPQGESLAVTGEHDLLILDILLPKKDGIAVLRDLRTRGMTLPVLLLTAKDSTEDKVEGLDSGADDYLVKPFQVSELRARLRALMRRESGRKSGDLQVADLRMDPATHEAWRGDTPLDLTAKEFSLLEYLMRNANRLVTREMVVAHLWDYDQMVTSNVVDVHIRRLRRKVDDPYDVKLIETLRGAGYRLRAPGGKA